jgi:Zn-dependent protease
MPFRCQYCGGYFCSQHRLPENHDCPRLGQARVPRDEARPVIVQKPIEYTYVSPSFLQRKFHFSGKEVEHLALATILVVGVGLSLDLAGSIYVNSLLLALSTVAFTVSFLLHEIAHKIVAQKHGLWAEFRIVTVGAILTAASILLPLKFISPGAVMVAGSADKKTMGKTAIAGPVTNIVLAAVFSIVAAGLPSYTYSFGVIAWFNAWIAVINLVPFAILDGMKIFVWNKVAWALAFAASAGLTAIFTIVFLA